MSSVFNLPFHSPLLKLYKTVLPHDDEKACIFKSTLLPFCRVDAEERINWGRSMIRYRAGKHRFDVEHLLGLCSFKLPLGFSRISLLRCMFATVIYRWWERQERKIKWSRGEILPVLNKILRFFQGHKKKKEKKKKIEREKYNYSVERKKNYKWGFIFIYIW